MCVSQRSGNNDIWLHRFAIFTSFATFCLIIAGSLVTSTDSGLAVPDWPLSYGQVMPPMVGGIFYEHGHRIVATFVGFLTAVLALWLWRKDDRRWVRTLGWIGLLAVIIQGVLGGLTVLFLLPTPISVSHAMLAQSYFCLTLVLAMATSPVWQRQKHVELATIGKTRSLAIATSAAILFQLMLGALMRHTQSGLAIPDFPMSYGNLLPPFDSSSLPLINIGRQHLDLPPVELGQILIHFAHRLGAILVTVVLLANVRHIFASHKADQKLREPALILIVLLVVQLFLGALTVWTGKSVEVATAHVATGALLLGTSVVIVVRSYHLYKLPVNSHSLSLSPEVTLS